MSAEFYQEYIESNRAIIYKICRAYAEDDPEFQDYFQEVCLQLWKARKNFNHESKLSTWIYRVTLNVCLSLVRTKRNKPQKVEIREYHATRVPEDEDLEALRLDMLYKAIRKLKEVDRGIILLYLESKSYQDIADIMGISMSHVGVKVNRIKKQLKNMING
ncbi:sigma-70 family RNA polymerase sigma factor [Fulvivirgaceae bacterium BMA10]|uniref:Sigma-70 family RNA polymerase sigma factor n=1 Tax=Splendidivirga corallicola TaxID=3051826 RepID=A0ABT8KHX7_9BACT|nr:sigma-70 family RNA polymerase sigma factor [Fulvivirgaceae bacterium BMA10]